MDTTTRNADLSALATMLTEQQSRKVDLVVPATKMWADSANIVVSGTEPILTEDGVTSADGTYVPTRVFDEGISAKLGVPLSYVRRMRETRPDLWDANVNGWLYGDPAGGIDADHRSFMLRGFKPETPGADGIARALLSDSYQRIDNLDVLMATLDGVRKAGVEVNVHSADLTDRRMVVRVTCPQVRTVATELLKDYRSPFTGQTGTDNPVMFAGFEISNSETGGGAFAITPRVVVEVCTNGMKITKDCMRSVHTGGKLEEGVVNWSDETAQRHLALITSKSADAVSTFLNVEYLERTVVKLTEAAGRPIDKPEEQVKTLGKSVALTEEQQASVLSHFIRGGQMTVGGVANAITAYAQEVESGDEAYDLENAAAKLLGV